MESKNHHSAGDYLMQVDNLDKLSEPWKGESSPLVSLLDMLKFYAEDFCAFMHELEALLEAGIFDSSRPGLTSKEVDRTYELIKKASNWCKLVELGAAQRLIKQIQTRILISGWDFMGEPYSLELGETLMALRNIIKDELRERLFMFVPKDRAPWYEKKDGFGVPVSNAFRSATKDIKEAGTCYATGRYTACVFHSMRVLEHGLRALAKEVGMDIGRKTWGPVIGKIKATIETLYNPPPPKKSKISQTKEEIDQQQFLSQAAVELGFFKDAWRNPVSHNLPNYDGPEALRVLNHVSVFMGHLATKLKE